MIRPTFPPSTPPRGALRKPTGGASRHALSLLVALAAAALPACEEPGREERVFGHINFTDLPREFHIPETATAGVPVRIAVWTQGGGCHRGGDTEVDDDGMSAVVTPFDYVNTGADICTDLLARFDHGTTVVFAEPGDAEVVVRYSTDSWHHNTEGRKVYPLKVSPAG